MIYILFIIGIIICIYGWKLIVQENKVHGEAFKEVIAEQNKDNIEYIKILTLNNQLKNKIDTMEKKLNTILMELKETKQISVKEKVLNKDAEITTKNEAENINKDEVNYPNYSEAANKIEQMTEENKSIEEMASVLNMGKGEVLLLKRLLTK